MEIAFSYVTKNILLELFLNTKNVKTLFGLWAMQKEAAGHVRPADYCL